jgi:hypothetical protein
MSGERGTIRRRWQAAEEGDGPGHTWCSVIPVDSHYDVLTETQCLQKWSRRACAKDIAGSATRIVIVFLM